MYIFLSLVGWIGLVVFVIAGFANVGVGVFGGGFSLVLIALAAILDALESINDKLKK